VLAAIRFRRVWLSPLRQVYPQLRALQAQPARALRLLGASGGITAAYVLALVAAVEAVGGAPLVPVVAVYLGASAVAAAAPTPGGLGAIEAGLVAGLTSVGMQPAEAVTAVLIFRLVTYWGPVLPGAAAFWLLRRGGAI
jgi:undecaprenyl-diphosphatase